MATIALNTKDPFLLSPATGEPFTIANLDVTNSIYIGPEIGLYGVQAGNLNDPTVDTLAPLARIVYTGRDAKYGLAVSGLPTVQVSPGIIGNFQAI